MNLTIIASVSENNVIGNRGKIPWHISEDLKRFKKLTMGHPVIMGRRTYESLPEKSRPLPGRKNIVLSESIKKDIKIYLAKSVREALEFAKDQDPYIIGGEKIYELFLPIVGKMEITRVHKEFEGDSFFPDVDWDDWELIRERRMPSQNIPYSFQTYSRK
jgi:dihydrofolate reductase